MYTMPLACLLLAGAALTQDPPIRVAPQDPNAPKSAAEWKAPYPRSRVISGVTFRDASARTLAPGSDIWPITWADDGHLYTSWGDGGGFGGTNKDGRVSLGFGRVEGGRDGHRGVNIAGGKDASHAAPFTGKTEGLLAIGNTLYCWRNAQGSNMQTFERTELYRSGDQGATWRFTGVAFGKKDGSFPPGDEGFYAPAVCQFGQGNRGARDEYVYVYAPDIVDPSHWNLRKPGRIHLMRVPARRIDSQAAYEFFAGNDARGNPKWTRAAGERKPVWQDAVNGTHRMAVSYNPGLKRYLLTTVTVSRDGWMSIYDAPEPWGPWTLVHVERKPERWGRLVILYTFVNKWLSKNGRDFVMVHTKNDSWATIEGSFDVRD